MTSSSDQKNSSHSMWFFGVTGYERLFMTVILVDALVLGGLKIGYYFFASDPNWLRILLSVVVLNLFEIWFAWDARSQRNTYQVFCLIPLVSYSLLHTFMDVWRVKIDHPRRATNWTWVAILCSFQLFFILVYIWLGTRLNRQFGWWIYKSIGADLERKKMCRYLYIFTTLVKLSVFIYLPAIFDAFVDSIYGDDLNWWALTLHIIAIILVILSSIIAVCSVQQEWFWGMFFAAAGMVYVMAYCVVEFYITIQNGDLYYLTMGAATLLLDIINLILLVICTRNFGKGMKEFFQDSKNKDNFKRGRSMELDLEDQGAGGEPAILPMDPDTSLVFTPKPAKDGDIVLTYLD